jgi:hypothetical protein
MANIEQVQKYAVLIREKGKRRVQTPPKSLGYIGWIHTNGYDLDVLLGDLTIETLELSKLRSAERSPIAPIKKVEDGFFAAFFIGLVGTTL